MLASFERHLGLHKVIIQTEDEKNSIRFVVLLHDKGNQNFGYKRN
jgi:hypothetical protein